MSTPNQPVAATSSALPERSPGLLVYACGVGTTALVLLLVQALNGTGFNAMGLYANGILPVGAILVGVASGVGYALGSRFLNVKLSRGFVFGMLATGVGDWFALQYFEYASILEHYRVAPTALGFFDYLTQTATSMSFARAGSSSEGVELGRAGYFFKALELGGFALGTMVPAWTLFAMPYCRRCRLYLKADGTSFVRSAVLQAEVMKLGRFRLKSPEREALLQTAQAEVRRRAVEVFAQIERAPLAVVRSVLAGLDGAASRKDKPAAQVSICLKKCPRCESHHLVATLATFAANGRPATGEVFKLDKTQGYSEPAAAPAEAS
ncbi:MAG: hypothetical protein A2138_20890 [Deltaproteobacteria bacterium RBG_16_71_12]|nr:MAG: hypothetical protein A2138_20890 [Deltaproteobacteria bacterium RBG_16_71_12]